MNPVEQVKDHLDGGRKWIKHTAFGDAGAVCIAGAVAQVTCAVRQGSPWTAAAPVDAYFDIVHSIGEVAREQFPERRGLVQQFNDHPDTTWADVELVLDKAAIRWDEAVR